MLANEKQAEWVAGGELRSRASVKWRMERHRVLLFLLFTLTNCMQQHWTHPFSFFCKSRSPHCWCYKRVVHGLLVFTVCLSLPIQPRVFPLEHSCLDLFINSDHRHRRLMKTEKQTWSPPGWIWGKKGDRPRPLWLEDTEALFISFLPIRMIKVMSG